METSSHAAPALGPDTPEQAIADAAARVLQPVGRRRRLRDAQPGPYGHPSVVSAMLRLARLVVDPRRAWTR